MANKLDLAEAQFIGWHSGVYGETAKGLAESMGLTKSEWLKIRECLSMSDKHKEHVDELFPSINKTK